MSSATGAGAVRIPPTVNTPRRFLRAVLPALSFALVLLGIAWLNPRAISYFGLNLMLNLGIPVTLATIAQMFVITVNDLDLSIGTFVSFVGCVAVTWLRDYPLFGSAVLLGGICVYALVGAVIHLRNVPSIVVTLGMLFVWQGLAILMLPKHGGKAPGWLHDFMNFHTPYVPFPILAGGEFVGGRVSPIGAVIGALTLTLAGSLLNFMRVSPDWQVGAQGAILIIVLAARALINRADGRTV